MGLFGSKSDNEIIAEGRALYIKGDLSGASLKLRKIANKGNPEACYLIAKIYLEIADKRERELYTNSAKRHLETAAEAGHKEAITLMAQKFGVSISNTEVDTKENAQTPPEKKADMKNEVKIDVVPQETKEAKVNNQANTRPAPQSLECNGGRKQAMLEIIKNEETSFKLEALEECVTSTVEKFIRHHNLGITLQDVVGFANTGLIAMGKKGHILTETFLFYSDNGKRGSKIELSNIASAESSKKHELYVTYTNGERKTFANIEYSSFADYYEKLLNQFAAIEMNVREEIAVQTEECEREAKAKAEAEAKSEEEVRIRRLVEEAANQIYESSRARIQNRSICGNQIIDMAAARYRIVQDGIQRNRRLQEMISLEERQQKEQIKNNYQKFLDQIGIDVKKENERLEKMYLNAKRGRKPYKHSEENYGDGIVMQGGGLGGSAYSDLYFRANWRQSDSSKIDKLIGSGKRDKLIDYGYPVAMYEKGYELYKAGRAGDIREAKLLFENAIKHSTHHMPKMDQFCYVYSFYYLGRICEEGKGVDRDPASAVSFYHDVLLYKDKVDQDFVYFADAKEGRREYQSIICDSLLGIARNFVYTVGGYKDHGKQIQQFITYLKGKDLLTAAQLVEPYLVDPENIQDVRQMYLSSKTDEGYLRAAQLYLEEKNLADRGWIVTEKCINTGLEIKLKREYLLATMREQGTELPKNLFSAYLIYKSIVAFRGSVGYEPMAAYRLALLYRDGRGAKRNLDEAHKYMKLAADDGIKEAQAALATLEQDSVLLPDQAKELENQGRMAEAMEVWHQAVLEQYRDIDGERLARIWLEGRLVPKNTQYAVEARYVKALELSVVADWKTLMHQFVDGTEMAPNYSLGLYCAKLALQWQSKQDPEAMYYKEFCRLFLHIQRGMKTPQDFYKKLIKMLEDLPAEQRHQQLKRLGDGVHGLEGMIVCVDYMSTENNLRNKDQAFFSLECLTALWGWNPDRTCLEVPSVAAEEAFCKAEVLGNACQPDVKALCSAYEEAVALGHSEAASILTTYFGNVKQSGSYPIPQDNSWPAYTDDNVAWMAFNGYAGALEYMAKNASERCDKLHTNFQHGKSESISLGTLLSSALRSYSLWMLEKQTSPRTVCDRYRASKRVYREYVQVKERGSREKGSKVIKPVVQVQDILKPVIQPGRIYAPACELAWSDHYAYARGVGIFGELYYWEDQREVAAHLAQASGYIHSVNRYESMSWSEECTYRANERDFRSREAYRKQLQAEQIAREIAMEEAEEEMERLQEERRREMAERRRQDESMDKFERFFNNLSGQGSWTNEELARMGKKTSDEMWTDEQLREMYRNKF